MIIGHITSSYGRLVNLFAVSVLLRQKQFKCVDCYNKITKTIWVFPNQNTFPFITEELRHFLDIKSTTSLTQYRVLSKFSAISKMFTTSQDDFNHISINAYGDPFPGDFIPVEKIFDSNLKHRVERLRRDTRGLIGFYSRDNDWDSSMGRTEKYLDVESYRNPSQAQSEHLVSMLLKLGYGVIRLGRASSKLMGIEHPNFFDYASSSRETQDKADFFLWSEIDFSVATVGGACQPGFFYGKPFLLWDFAEPIQNIINTIPRYPLGRVILVPRLNSENRSLFDLLKRAEFLENSINALRARGMAYGSIPAGFKTIKNFLVPDQYFSFD